VTKAQALSDVMFWRERFERERAELTAERELSDALATALREAIRLLAPSAPDGSPASGVVAESVALLISYHAARGGK